MSDMLAGLALVTTPSVFVQVLIGVAVVTIFAIIPGLGGPFAIAVVLPFALVLDPAPGIALLVAAAVVSGTGNTLTSVMFGVPGSPSGIAVTLDGYPMAQRGEGARAAAAGLGASALGGIVGAIVLALSLPILRPIVLTLSYPEFLTLIVGSLFFMASVTHEDTTKALLSGALGMLLSFIGLEGGSGTSRFVFGQPYLLDGLRLVPVMVGLFAFAEMMVLMRRGGTIASRATEDLMPMGKQVIQGLTDVIRHWRTTIQSSAIGLWVGIAPGVGDAAGQFIAYGQAARTSKNPEAFGKGAVEGVIAADAVTNSKEGGALIPTLAFGIPGTAALAVLIAAFISFGIRPGSQMLVDNGHIVWMIIWILVITNLIAAAVCLAIIPAFARLTLVRTSLIVGPVMVIGAAAAFATTGRFEDVLTALVMGLVGYGMIELKYSRVNFLIGFVLGSLIERNLELTLFIYGWSYFQRPIAVSIAALTIAAVLHPVIRSRRDARRAAQAKKEVSN